MEGFVLRDCMSKFLRRLSVQVDSCSPIGVGDMLRGNDDRRRRRNDEGGRAGMAGGEGAGMARGEGGKGGRERRQRDISCVAFPRKWIPAFAGMTRGEGAGMTGGKGGSETFPASHFCTSGFLLSQE